jgi:hypothetical protein
MMLLRSLGIYVGEGPVLAVLALEDDGPASANLHA